MYVDIKKLFPAAAKPAPSEKAFPDPTPARPTPLPARDSWKDLPKCFVKYHDLLDERRVLREHLRAIDAKRIELFGSNIDISQFTDSATAIGLRLVEGKTPQDNMTVTRHILRYDDPETQYQNKMLTRAYNSTLDELEKHKEDQNIPLQKMFVQCGHHRVSIALELQEIIDEVAKLGLEIFAQRVSALGLAEFQIVRLFQGSADFLKYVSTESAYTAQYSEIPAENGGGYFTDEAVEQSACHSLNMAPRIPEMKALLTEAKKTLAQARKVA